jgi:hypothetical protein
VTNVLPTGNLFYQVVVVVCCGGLDAFLAVGEMRFIRFNVYALLSFTCVSLCYGRLEMLVYVIFDSNIQLGK